MKTTFRNRPRALVGLVACLCLAVAATATASVFIYSNQFQRKSDLRELTRKAGGGQACNARLPGKKGFVRLDVTKDAYCGYVPPVTSDRPQPDLLVKAIGKIGSATPGAQRKVSFLAIRARAGGGEYYELQINPRRRRFTLSRKPNGGGFPVSGKETAIKGINRNNVMRLQTRGSKVIARVNGKKLAELNDPNPGSVGGRSVMFGVGTPKNTSKDVVSRYSQVKVGVPRP